jgi:hypothetical protein
MESSISRRSESRDLHLMDQIRRALETRDVDALAELYAENGVFEEVSALHPPAHPVVVQGREAIRKRLRDDFNRDAVGGWHREVKTVAIIDEMETDDHIAYTEVRTYAAGDKVVTQHMAHKRNGLIEHDRLVVARDSD